MKKFLKEFKEFATRGNMFDLAIGIIIGGAFTTIVNSLVNDIINPVLGIFTGSIDFSNLFVSLDGNHYDTLAAAEAAGANVFKYGSFISNVINFIIKIINRLRTPRHAEEQAPTTKKCPFCCSEIDIKATKCPHCTSLIEVDKDEMKA